MGHQTVLAACCLEFEIGRSAGKTVEKTSYILNKKPFQKFLLLSKLPVVKREICRGKVTWRWQSQVRGSFLMQVAHTCQSLSALCQLYLHQRERQHRPDCCGFGVFFRSKADKRKSDLSPVSSLLIFYRPDVRLLQKYVGVWAFCSP